MSWIEHNCAVRCVYAFVETEGEEDGEDKKKLKSWVMGKNRGEISEPGSGRACTVAIESQFVQV